MAEMRSNFRCGIQKRLLRNPWSLLEMPMWRRRKERETTPCCMVRYGGEKMCVRPFLLIKHPTYPYFSNQVPNDGLGLRQPVHITSLTYLSQTASSSQHHLLTGTSLGDVRRYDTRAARRPVVEWKGVGKLGGVKKVEKGFAEQYVPLSFTFFSFKFS